MNAERTEPVTLIDDDLARQMAEYDAATKARDAAQREALHKAMSALNKALYGITNGNLVDDANAQALVASWLGLAWHQGYMQATEDTLKALRVGGAR